MKKVASVFDEHYTCPSEQMKVIYNEAKGHVLYFLPNGHTVEGQMLPEQRDYYVQSNFWRRLK